MNLTPHKHTYPPEGTEVCEGCGFYCNDVEDAYKWVHRGDDGTGWAHHDVPQKWGRYCADCRNAEGLQTEAEV